MVQLLLSGSGNKVFELFGLLIEQLMRDVFHAHLDVLEVDPEVLDRVVTGFQHVVDCIEAQNAAGAFAAWRDVRAESEALRGEGVSATVSVYEGVKVRRFSRNK